MLSGATLTSAAAAAPGAARSPAVAIVWQRFGAYHLARLRGAAESLADRGWNVVGIEVAGHDEYQWTPAVDDAVSRRTLFQAADYTRLSSRAIRRAMADVLDDVRPEAVCINGWAAPEAVEALGWARRRGARAIVMSETHQSPRNPLKRAVKRRRLAGCDAAIVGGRVHAAYLEALGFEGRRVELGYDAVDNAHFERPACARPPWCDAITPHRYFFANTRFLPRKGIDALLRAYAWYRAACEPQESPWSVVISGSGEMEAEWKRLAAALGVARSVHWPGFLQYADLPAAYQSAGCFVHPARQEPWGLVVNEAAAAGLPLVVGRRVGAACELVEDGTNGFLVDPDDVQAFARVLRRVALMPEAERRAMGAASRALVSAFGPARFGHAVSRCLGLDDGA